MANPSPVTRWRDEVKTLVDAGLAASYPAGVPMPIGRLARNQLDKPPRVAWLIGDATDAPASGTGGNTRTLGTVLQKVVLECWADSFDSTWELLFMVRRAIDQAMHGSYRFLGHTWATEEEGGAAHENLGHLARLTLQVACPIPDFTYQTKTLTSAGHETSFEGAADPGCGS